MTTIYPASLDTFVNPSTSNNLSDPSVLHSSQHDNINDSVKAIETKVGVDNSAITITIDYLLKNTASIDPGHKHTNASIVPTGRTVTTASFMMLDSDGIVNINYAGTVAITGANNRTKWKVYIIKDTSGNAATNNITYTPFGGNIDGGSSVLIQQNYDSLSIFSDGTNEFTC